MLQNRQLQKLHFCFFNPWSMDLKIQASLRMNVTSNAVVWNVTTVRSITHLLEEIEFPTPKTLNLYITPKPTNQKKKNTSTPPFFAHLPAAQFEPFLSKPSDKIEGFKSTLHCFDPRFKTSSFTLRRSPATEISAPVILDPGDAAEGLHPGISISIFEIEIAETGSLPCFS